MKILITGGSGRVGRVCLKRLHKLFSEEDSLHLLEHVTQVPKPENGYFREVKIVTSIKETYDFCLHFAGLTDPNLCSGQENLALVMASNVSLTLRVLQKCQSVFYISSDEVFNGAEDEYGELADPYPHNCVGESKLLAEKYVTSKRGKVIRLQSVLGAPNPLVNTAIDILKGKLPQPSPLPFWNNIFFRPSWIEDFLSCVKALLRSKTEEYIFHCSCTGKNFSRADIARFVLEFFRKNNLERVTDTIDEEQCLSPYPKKLVLNSEKTQKILGLEFTDSQVALEKHLEQMLLAHV